MLSWRQRFRAIVAVLIRHAGHETGRQRSFIHRGGWHHRDVCVQGRTSHHDESAVMIRTGVLPIADPCRNGVARTLSVP
jgi:hypothetical protein